MPTTSTTTIKSSGGDYTSAVGWESGEQADLVSLDEIREGECYAFSDTSDGCTIDGWTTDATRYIRLYTPTGERHTGVTGTGYRKQSSGFVPGVDIFENNVRIEGIAFTFGSNLQDGIIVNDVTATRDIRISHCFIPNSGGFRAMLIFAGIGGVARIWNNLMYSASVGATNALVTILSGTVYVYNNTCVSGGGDYGFGALIVADTGNAIAKNNLADVATNSAVNCVCYSGDGFDAASTDNLSTDATAPGSNPETNVTPTYVNAGSFNYHLATGDTAAKDKGIDLSADGNLAFSDDIDGDTRSGSWDIGADEIFVAIVPSAPKMGRLIYVMP